MISNQQQTRPEIRFVDWGVANHFGDFIEVNRNLKDYPELFNPIMEHELRHSIGPVTIQDIRNDFFTKTNISNIGLLKFMVKHPKSITQIFPFYYTTKKGFVYDISATLFWMVLISFTSLLVWGASLIV